MKKICITFLFLSACASQPPSSGRIPAQSLGTGQVGSSNGEESKGALQINQDIDVTKPGSYKGTFVYSQDLGSQCFLQIEANRSLALRAGSILRGELLTADRQASKDSFSGISASTSITLRIPEDEFHITAYCVTNATLFPTKRIPSLDKLKTLVEKYFSVNVP